MRQIINTQSLYIADENAMIELGGLLADAIDGQAVIYLDGDLGVGKTTLTRGLLRQKGHQGVVKSPTYSLVEVYQLTGCSIYHFDLYRLVDSEELEYLGIRDYFADPCVLLVEWPDRGSEILPQPDCLLSIAYQGHGRQVSWHTYSPRGQAITAFIYQHFDRS